jgi:hypothetical protein
MALLGWSSQSVHDESLARPMPKSSRKWADLGIHLVDARVEEEFLVSLMQAIA